MVIRKAEPGDTKAIAAIILPIIRESTTYTLDANMSEADALAYWMGPDKETFVAEKDGVILGTYYMRPNQAGGGRHVLQLWLHDERHGNPTWDCSPHVRAFAGACTFTRLSGHAVQFRRQHE